MVQWQDVDTILLDMDGTLLDLYYDDYFWQQYVPEQYAVKHGLSVVEAKSLLEPKFKAHEGTLAWYCVDFWSQQLGLNIPRLKQDCCHLIAIHPGVEIFLNEVGGGEKRLLMVTNAHTKVIDLKFKKTGIDKYFDVIVSSHELGFPKEDVLFWEQLVRQEVFDPYRTLFIDDSLPILHTAKIFGIRHLLTIKQPSSQGLQRMNQDFPVLDSFLDILPSRAQVSLR